MLAKTVMRRTFWMGLVLAAVTGPLSVGAGTLGYRVYDIPSTSPCSYTSQCGSDPYASSAYQACYKAWLELVGWSYDGLVVKWGPKCIKDCYNNILGTNERLCQDSNFKSAWDTPNSLNSGNRPCTQNGCTQSAGQCAFRLDPRPPYAQCCCTPGTANCTNGSYACVGLRGPGPAPITAPSPTGPGAPAPYSMPSAPTAPKPPSLSPTPITAPTSPTKGGTDRKSVV